MNLPTRSRCACHAVPDWFPSGDGTRGRYQHQCRDEHGRLGDWAATTGPIPEPEARRIWDERFGQGVPVWPYEQPLHIPAVSREERPTNAC